MHRDPTPILYIERLHAGYGRQPVLQGVSFCVQPGTVTALLGANGSGKTTLLKVLCRQLPFTGQCVLCGQPLTAIPRRALARQISYIPQRSGIGVSLPVLDVVLMGFNPVLGLLEHPTAAQRQTALQALATVGLEAYAQQDYQRLSEGQKQLCIWARTLVEDAALLLLDEPESALDFAHRHQIMRLLRDRVRGGNRAALVTLHDPALALEYAGQLILLKDGVCTAVLQPATDSLAYMEQALQALYGPVRLVALAQEGTRRLILLPAP